MQAQQVRALIEDNRPTNPNEGYAEHVRRTVAHYAADCRARGQTWSDIATIVGVSAGSLTNWCKQFPRFLPVTVTDAQTPLTSHTRDAHHPHRGLVLRTPDGFALEGLDLHDALHLLQALR